MNVQLLKRARAMPEEVAGGSCATIGGMIFLDYLIARAVTGGRPLLVAANLRADYVDARTMLAWTLMKC